MNTSGKRYFSSTKDSFCDDGIKMIVITVGDPSSTLTPTISPTITPADLIIYEIPTWKQGHTYNDIDTLVYEKVRIEISYGHNIVEYPDEQSYNTCSNAEILVEESSNLDTYDIDLNEIGTRYIGCSVDEHDCNELQKFKIVTWPENEATIDIKWNKNAIQKRYQASLGDMLKLSYNNNKYDVIEFENAEDYEACNVNKYARKWETGEDMINMNTSGKRYFSSTKDSFCDDGIKMIVITVGDPSSTLTPTNPPTITPVIYEITNWRQGPTYNDIDTLVNQKVRIEISYGHNIVEYPDEQSYNTCSNGNILVEESSNLETYDIDLNEIGTRYIGCSVDEHDCNELQKFKIVTCPENEATIDIEWNKNAIQKRYQASLGDMLKL